MPSVRVQRVRELLKRQLGEIIRRHLPSEMSTLTSVNDVSITPDLKAATVYLGVIASPKEQEKIVELLNLDRPHLQNLVAQAVVLRNTPKLRFQLDHSVERGNRILSILDELDPPSSNSPS